MYDGEKTILDNSRYSQNKCIWVIYQCHCVDCSSLFDLLSIMKTFYLSILTISASLALNMPALDHQRLSRVLASAEQEGLTSVASRDAKFFKPSLYDHSRSPSMDDSSDDISDAQSGTTKKPSRFRNTMKTVKNNVKKTVKDNVKKTVKKQLSNKISQGIEEVKNEISQEAKDKLTKVVLY